MTKKLLMLILSSTLIFTGCNVNLSEGDTEDTQQMITVDEAKDILINKYNFTEEDLEGFDAYAFVKHYSLTEMEYDEDGLKQLYEKYKDKYKDDGYSEMFYIFDATSKEDLEETDEISKIGIEFGFGDEWEDIVVDFEKDEYYYNELGHIYTNPIPSTSLQDDIYMVCNWKHDIDAYSRWGGTGSVSYKVIIETTDYKYCCYEGGGQNSKKFPKGYEDLYDEVQAIIK